jgi:hypothetical protein
MALTAAGAKRKQRVGLLWRAEWDAVDDVETCKLHGMFAALTALGVNAEPVLYTDESADALRAQLLSLDGVLVWVNPIERERDRSRLDALLREAADAGVFVSAHPDVILKMGTKEVLVLTQGMSWGTETRMYRTFDELRDQLPDRLTQERPVVLKRYRGMGGDGVWKVEPDGAGPFVFAQHAAGAAPPQRLTLDEFLARCEPYFEDGAPMIEQPFQRRLDEGMIRAYLTHDRVVGFTHQYPRGLMPPGRDDRGAGKVFELPSEPKYRGLRTQLEAEWVQEMQTILDIDTCSLPVIWDADFLYGPQTSAGADTYVLCEINVSSTFAFPEFAMPGVAEATIERIREGATRKDYC